MFAEANRCGEVARVRANMKEFGVEKKSRDPVGLK
ncbi:hypothetical protein OROMI_001121 [Orobanche minor]